MGFEQGRQKRGLLQGVRSGVPGPGRRGIAAGESGGRVARQLGLLQGRGRGWTLGAGRKGLCFAQRWKEQQQQHSLAADQTEGILRPSGACSPAPAQLRSPLQGQQHRVGFEVRVASPALPPAPGREGTRGGVVAFGAEGARLSASLALERML